MIGVACHKQGSFSIQAMMDTLHTGSLFSALCSPFSSSHSFFACCRFSPAQQIELLINSLQQDVVRIITNSSGHFVVLRFLQRFPFPYTKFIHEAIQKSCLEICTDHHGLRVIKAVIDIGPVGVRLLPFFACRFVFVRFFSTAFLFAAQELHGVFKTVSRLTMKLAENQYGNYCIQHVLDAAPANVCSNIKMKMEGKYVRLSKQKFSSNVVEKCLRQSSYDWRSVIIRELTSAVGELIRDRFVRSFCCFLFFDRLDLCLLFCSSPSYGNYVLQTVASVADAKQVQMLVRAVTPYLSLLRDNVRSKWEKILKAAQMRTQQSQLQPVQLPIPVPPPMSSSSSSSSPSLPPPPPLHPPIVAQSSQLPKRF